MPSDEDVIERIKAGDPESYGLLAARHNQRLHRIAQKFARDAFDAEDAVQSAHLLALRHMDQYEGRSPYVQWMATITVNEVRTNFRRNKVAMHSDELRDCYAASGPNPEQLAMGRDLQRVLNRALERIPPEYSLVFRMRELADMTTAETGRRLGLTKACVKTRLHRARSMLRNALERQLESRRSPYAAGGNGAYPGLRGLPEQSNSFA